MLLDIGIVFPYTKQQTKEIQTFLEMMITWLPQIFCVANNPLSDSEINQYFFILGK